MICTRCLLLQLVEYQDAVAMMITRMDFSMFGSAAEFYAEQLIQFLRIYTYTQIFHLQKEALEKSNLNNNFIIIRTWRFLGAD